MKALTLWQPWASLVALGYKSVETRSWATSYRGELAIHAARREPRDWKRPFLLARGIRGHTYGYPPTPHILLGADPETHGPWPLHLGCVVAICRLVDCVPTENIRFAREPLLRSALGDRRWLDVGFEIGVHPDEEEVGDYRRGRFAWLLEDIRRLPEPIPARGRQQLWDWKEAV